MVDTMRRTTEKIKRDPWYKHKMAEPKKQFKFDRNVYDDGVVVAKYRSCDQPNRYLYLVADAQCVQAPCITPQTSGLILIRSDKTWEEGYWMFGDKRTSSVTL